jgi:hypothetical protein
MAVLGTSDLSNRKRVNRGDGENEKLYEGLTLGNRNGYEQTQLYLSTYDPFLPASLRHKRKYVGRSLPPGSGAKTAVEQWMAIV